MLITKLKKCLNVQVCLHLRVVRKGEEPDEEGLHGRQDAAGATPVLDKPELEQRPVVELERLDHANFAFIRCGRIPQLKTGFEIFFKENLFLVFVCFS
jgi:hypothetical protein